MIRYADAADSRLVLMAGAHGVQLRAPGAALQFQGEWALRTGDDARVFGRCTLGIGSPSRRASLLVAALPADDPQALAVTLHAADGQVLLGPLVLQRVAPATAAATPSLERPAWPRQTLSSAPAAWPAVTP